MKFPSAAGWASAVARGVAEGDAPAPVNSTATGPAAAGLKLHPTGQTRRTGYAVVPVLDRRSNRGSSAVGGGYSAGSHIPLKYDRYIRASRLAAAVQIQPSDQQAPTLPDAPGPDGELNAPRLAVHLVTRDCPEDVGKHLDCRTPLGVGDLERISREAHVHTQFVDEERRGHCIDPQLHRAD